MGMNLDEFVTELANRLEFDHDDTGRASWKCGSEEDRLFYARQLADETGFNLDAHLAVKNRCCDCEIVFNDSVDPVESEDEWSYSKWEGA